ncbi:uncharacterized protein LOC141532860 [Cotesia typhae]|uniref:uncharacterized protein LOC141532860 n=1 Tax=Cotesia typhae TaxID=2053667 RepID=UPI003D69D405
MIAGDDTTHTIRLNNFHMIQFSGIFIAVITQFIGIKGAIEIIIEDVLCPIFNEEYVTEPHVYIDVNNRAFVNFSIIKQLPPDVQLEFHVLGVSMGEYLIQTGIDFEMSLCDMFNEPVILGPKVLNYLDLSRPIVHHLQVFMKLKAIPYQ